MTIINVLAKQVQQHNRSDPEAPLPTVSPQLFNSDNPFPSHDDHKQSFPGLVTEANIVRMISQSNGVFTLKRDNTYIHCTALGTYGCLATSKAQVYYGMY